MTRLDILNQLVMKIKAQSYLEIGVENGYTFLNIDVETKIGVDPDTQSKANVFKTSNSFFATNNDTFDLIFIDGLHHADQVEEDIYNSLKILNHNGYIVCHDMLPTTKEMQTIPRIQNEWTGDCWKAWVKIRSLRNDLTMYVVDTDFGCGIIQKGRQDLLHIHDSELYYKNFCSNKKQWMNIISINEFQTKLGIHHE